MNTPVEVLLNEVIENLDNNERNLRENYRRTLLIHVFDLPLLPRCPRFQLQVV